MIESFFSCKEDAHLFDDTTISREQNYRKYQGQHPVIFLRFSQLNANNYKEFYKKVKKMISTFYRKFKEMLLPFLTPEEAKDYNNICNENASKIVFMYALYALTSYLYRHSRKSVLILIDDVDIPFRLAYQHGFLEEASSDLISLIMKIGKGNPYAFHVVMTSVIPTHFSMYFSSMPQRISTMAGGIIQADLRIFKKIDASINTDRGGYLVGDQADPALDNIIVNPCPVILNPPISNFLLLHYDKIIKVFDKIAKDGSFSVNEFYIIDDYYRSNFRLEEVASLLLHTGLLRVSRYIEPKFVLIIPNQQARKYFEELKSLYYYVTDFIRLPNVLTPLIFSYLLTSEPSYDTSTDKKDEKKIIPQLGLFKKQPSKHQNFEGKGKENPAHSFCSIL